MRKLFELFLSLFRPVPEDVVNTGYMAEKQSEQEYRKENGLCLCCGGSKNVAPEGTHPDLDFLCTYCFHEDCAREEREREGKMAMAIYHSKDPGEAFDGLIQSYEKEFGPYTGPAPEWFDHEAAVCERIEKQMSARGDDSFCIR